MKGHLKLNKVKNGYVVVVDGNATYVAKDEKELTTLLYQIINPVTF